jgi:hypothetical protein
VDDRSGYLMSLTACSALLTSRAWYWLHVCCSVANYHLPDEPDDILCMVLRLLCLVQLCLQHVDGARWQAGWALVCAGVCGGSVVRCYVSVSAGEGTQLSRLTCAAGVHARWPHCAVAVPLLQQVPPL